MSHPQKIDELRADVPDVFAVEMEGAAVAQVCDEHDIPFIVIRTISDKSDHSAVIDFQAFIKEVSSKYSCGLLKRFSRKDSNEVNSFYYE